MMPRFSIDMNALTGKIRMNNPMEKSKCCCPVFFVGEVAKFLWVCYTVGRCCREGIRHSDAVAVSVCVAEGLIAICPTVCAAEFFCFKEFRSLEVQEFRMANYVLGRKGSSVCSSMSAAPVWEWTRARSMLWSCARRRAFGVARMEG